MRVCRNWWAIKPYCICRAFSVYKLLMPYKGYRFVETISASNNMPRSGLSKHAKWIAPIGASLHFECLATKRLRHMAHFWKDNIIVGIRNNVITRYADTQTAPFARRK